MPRQGRWKRVFIERFEGLPWLLGAGFNQPGRSIPLTPHSHEGCEFTFLEDGAVCWETCDGAKLELRGGSLGMTKPGALHWGRSESISPCKLIWFIADLKAHDRESLRAAGRELARKGDASLQASPSLVAQMRELKNALALYAEKPEDPLFKARLQTAVEHAVVLAAIEFREPSKREAKPGRGLAEIARKLVEADSRRPPELREMAEAAKLSPARFARLFKEEAGMTPADFALRLRCEMAERTLRSSGLSVTEAAFRHGFSSSQHFAAAFKRVAGRSPGSVKRPAKP